MKKNQLLAVFLMAMASIPLYAQKIKIERENIFPDKADKLVYEAAYKEMQPDETYAFAWNYSSDLPYMARVPLGFGRQVELGENPDYTFEYYLSRFMEPKVEYIKIEDMMPSKNRMQGGVIEYAYIARLVYSYEFNVKILDKKNGAVKTLLISDASKPYVYYYCREYDSAKDRRVPRIVSNPNGKDTGGWLTPELLALKMKENQGRINEDINEGVLKFLFLKARRELGYMMHGTQSGLDNGRFKMHTIKKKQQKDFPDMAARLADLRSCFIQWARDKEDVSNLDKLAEFASAFSENAEVAQERNLKLLYHMDAALAYLMCKEYDKAAIQCGDGMKYDRGFLQMAGETAIGMYRTMKKLESLKQSSDTINTDVVYDLEEDYRKLKE